MYNNDLSNINELEKLLKLNITTRDDWLILEGDTEAIDQGKEVLSLLETAKNQGIIIRNSDFHYVLRAVYGGRSNEIREVFTNPLVIKLKRKSIIPKTINQKSYLQHIEKNPITFGIGPAGTGKTYLAMAMALKQLLNGSVERIIITRPAVEAGEALGFLPGELQEKILPFLTPIYDAMTHMIGQESTNKLVERGTIEIAPLAYMRGRTLSNSFVVLDEAQNTTHEQMMMFLTRLGDESRMVITGDITQIDLPKSKQSGLKEAAQILNKIKGIELFYFNAEDIVRHPLVQSIINAYEKN
ncbi:MAG: PhoH family protein [Puniceicoccaceae bacterium]|nr:PhoH family protein [Puniceicoccaceae bacterium]